MHTTTGVPHCPLGSRRIGAAWIGRRRGVDPRDFEVSSLILEMGLVINRSSELCEKGSKVPHRSDATTAGEWAGPRCRNRPLVCGSCGPEPPVLLGFGCY